jgi:transcriptional regulator with XRE-family HTH domain
VPRAFGVVIRNARRECDISQETLAERADVDRIYRSLLARGLRQPTPTYLFVITDALDMNPAGLLHLRHARLHSSCVRRIAH